jgi:hypothetical protein
MEISETAMVRKRSYRARSALGRTESRRRIVRQLLVGSAGLLMFVGTGGASPAPRRPGQSDRPQAWMDAKNMCVFSLGEGRMPEDPNELSVALKEGWKPVISVPDPQRAVVIQGDSYPSLETLKINLSDAELHPPAKKQKVELNNRVEKNLDVQHLEVRGEPVLLKKAKLNMRLTADGARIDMERDRRGRPVMLLAQAKSGTLSFDVSRADAEALMLQNAREMASPYGVKVEKMQLLVVPETPRSVQAELYVETKVALIPAGMLFKAHVTVDDKMNARISGLSCEGDEALGPIIVHFLRPALARYEGRTRPLVSFPKRGMHLHDVAVRVDDRLHLTAAFGS